jgi:Ion channel
MVLDILLAAALLALSVVIHAAALNNQLRWLTRRTGLGDASFWRSTWLLVGIAFRLVISHMLQVLCWGVFYFYEGVFAHLRSAVYFSIVTYTTVGYGDLVPSEPWRWAAGVEGLTGILMCGWSTAFFFAVVMRVYPQFSGQTAR